MLSINSNLKTYHPRDRKYSMDSGDRTAGKRHPKVGGRQERFRTTPLWLVLRDFALIVIGIQATFLKKDVKKFVRKKGLEKGKN